MLIWGAILALHLLGVAAWVGGLAFLVLAVFPGLSGGRNAALLEAMTPVLDRGMRVLWHAVPLVLVSGYLILFGFYGGFREVGWTVHCMHLLGLIMAALFVLVAKGPWRALRDFPDMDYVMSMRRLSLVMLALGVLTVLVAALGHFG